MGVDTNCDTIETDCMPRSMWHYDHKIVWLTAKGSLNREVRIVSNSIEVGIASSSKLEPLTQSILLTGSLASHSSIECNRACNGASTELIVTYRSQPTERVRRRSLHSAPIARIRLSFANWKFQFETKFLESCQFYGRLLERASIVDLLW